VAAAQASRWSNVAFALAFAVTLYFFYEVVAPFVIPVLVGAFVVILFAPAHERLVRLLGARRRRLASALSSCGVLLLLLLPAAGAIYLLAGQAGALLSQARDLLGPGGLEDLLGGRVPPSLEPLAAHLRELGIANQLERLVASAANWLAGLAPGVFGATTVLVVDAFLVVVSMYYFFLDGPRLLAEAARLSPLEARYEREFLQEFRSVAQTMIYVNLVTSLLQGVAGGIGFWLVGLPQPLAWAALMALLSLVPILGTGLVWVPAGVGLLLAGKAWQGIFLLAWGVLVIGSIDNLLRPFLAKGRIALHPLLIFVTIFGGIAAFGPAGALLGPLIGSIFTAMVRIWKRDFVPRLGKAGRRRRAARRPRRAASLPAEAEPPQLV